MSSRGKKLCYVILLHIPATDYIEVGALGLTELKGGCYAYIGSGGANPIKRIARHFKADKRLRWHIDYVTAKYRPIRAFLVADSSVREADLSSILEKSFPYVPKFGSSDSKNKSHLFYVGNDREESIKNLLGALYESKVRTVDVTELFLK